MLLSVLLFPGIDYRRGWSRLPIWVPILSSLVMAIAFIFEYIVVKQNEYLYRTVDVTENQKVITTGLYSIIRHPMYLFGIIIVLSMPLILGSIYSCVALFCLIVPLFVMRIINEEKILLESLNGYKTYAMITKYRLIPFIW
jgi:protein-S-isoprenylcysteine O-methyltransferase Ste14